ncbi:centrosomal protein of 70 kDa [Rhincodon typus]|uniref:centrosomal protein of 70 kDa n=1 Tax=Rhincodon typus TaxID=259920 RepID=UPI0009A27C7B|nr:centrosomal protein of 70 kDa [Rhincodon typus]
MSSTYRHLSWGVDKDNLQQYEQSEWDRLNKLLQHHGFKAVQLADPRTTKNWRDMVLLDKQSVVEISKMVSTLMKDAERRQTLICDLIQSNRELRNELCQWQSKMSSKEQCTSNAEQLQDAAKLKIQEMQGDYFVKCCRLQKQVEQLQHDEQDMQIQLQQLNQNLQEKEKTIVRLKKKLYMIVTEEEQHIERQNKLFLQFNKLTTRAQTTSNKNTRKSVFEDIPRERKEQLGNNRKQKYSVLDEIPEGKVLIKACEDHLKGTSYRNHQTFKKNQNFQVIESFTGSSCHAENEEEFISAKVEAVDSMQEAACKRLLENICKELGVTDVNYLLPVVCERSWFTAAHSRLQKGCKSASPQTLEAIVSHFQKLFDVSSLSGIYPRMNEVYCKLGEMNNAMKNLRQVLGLAETTPPSVLVNMIGKLCSLVNADTYRQVQRLLDTQDVDSIITKLEEHEEFFPVFYTVFKDLLQILEVDSMDHVLPAVSALKLKTR